MPEPGGLVVAIDGPSGSGKSTTSRGVAGRLGLRYLDTGAMYRAVTWWLLEHGVAVDDPAAVAAHAGTPSLRVGTDPRRPTIYVDDVDVGAAVRTPEVTAAVSAVSAVPEVRARMVRDQREIIGSGGIVIEGRDIGTTVAPAAPVKVFLSADDAVRARRRAAESVSGVTVESTRLDLARRDRLDSARAASPLTKAADAITIDTTDLSVAEAVDRVCDLAARAVAR